METKLMEFGLSPIEIDGLTGFTLPLVYIFAYAGDALAVADLGNYRAIIKALATMLAKSHSTQKNERLLLRVLTRGFDEHQTLAIVAALRVERDQIEQHPLL